MENCHEDMLLRTFILFARVCVQMAMLRDGFEVAKEEVTSTFEELQRSGTELQRLDFYKKKMLQ